MKQSEERKHVAIMNIEASTDSGIATGRFDATSPFRQVLKADPRSEIAHSSVTFPPGSLAVSTSVSIQEGSPIANAALAGVLSIPSGFQTVAAPVAVTSPSAVSAARPFTISIPIPAPIAGLTVADAYENLLVAYVIKVAATGETRAGVLPRSMLTIAGNTASFETRHFGVFQAAFAFEKIHEERKVETSVLSAQTKLEQKSLPPLEITSRSPFVVREGQSVTLRGKNIRPTVRLALSGKSISSLNLASDGSLSFTAPLGTATGLLTLHIEQEGTKQDVSLVFDKNGSYPVISANKARICNDIQFYDLDGVLQSGERDCAGTVPNCSSDGEIGCKTTPSVKAAHTANLAPGNIKAGSIIGGVMGEYPSSLYPLAAATATADLDAASFSAKIKSNAPFEWFDSAGSRFSGAGEPNITPGLILEGVSIFGTVGTYVPGAMNVPFLSATKAENKVVLSWTRQGGVGIILVRRAGASVSFAPSHGVIYPQGYTSGPNEVIYRGSGETIDDTNVTVGTVYTYRAFAYNDDNAYSPASTEASVLHTGVEVCGGAGDSCYEDTVAMLNGVATTPSGKNLVYVDNGKGFKVWKDAGSNRILRANGLDQWAMKLNLNGKGFLGAGNEFLNYSELEGRKCPTHVYIDDSNKFSAGNCLYYSSGYGAQSLDSGGASQTLANAIGLTDWTNYNAGSPKWLVGNIKTCSDLGMRLPTIFETVTTAIADPNYPTIDGTPGFAGASKGIPPHPSGASWTASSSTSDTNTYWTWSGASPTSNFYFDLVYIRCTLP